MSLSASPSPRAADPKTHPYTGLGFQVPSVFRKRFHSSRRRLASSPATGAARCSRLSSCTRFLPICVARTVPCSTRRVRHLRTPISDPRGVRAATSPAVRGLPARASTARTGPSSVGVMARVGSVRFTILKYRKRSNKKLTIRSAHLRALGGNDGQYGAGAWGRADILGGPAWREITGRFAG